MTTGRMPAAVKPAEFAKGGERRYIASIVTCSAEPTEQL